mgnify:CR=1 FL=1
MTEQVIVTKSKLDALATSIANKSGESLPMTIAEMKTAVDGITTGGVVVIDSNDSHGGIIRTIETQNIIKLQEKTVTPTFNTQTITPDTGYAGFSSVNVGAFDSIVEKVQTGISGDIVYNGTTLRPYLFTKNTLITSFTGNNVTDCSGDNISDANVYTFNGCTNLEYV